MSIEKKIKQLCKQNSDIQIEEIDLENREVSVIFPYETAVITVELEGDTEEMVVESFKVGVNKRLDDMRDYLEECKFDL